jgi:hypothetical protein
MKYNQNLKKGKNHWSLLCTPPRLLIRYGFNDFVDPDPGTGTRDKKMK